MIPYRNYDVPIDKVREQLDKYGIAVIPNVLNSQEVLDTRKGMWQLLESLSKEFPKPIRENDPKTWGEMRYLFPIRNFDLAHAQYIWDVRQNETVTKIFADLWNCKPKDLITSFDGFSVNFPPETTGKGWRHNPERLHVDQSFTRNDFECIQGMVTAWDIEEKDTSFTFFESSHQKHKAFKDHYNVKSTGDWYKLTHEEHLFYTENGHPQVALKCSAGSLILWDSRLVHTAIKAQEGRKSPKIRHMIYICQMPRTQCSKAVLDQRVDAFEQSMTTNHWAIRPRFFSKSKEIKRMRRKPPTVISPPAPVLTELGKKLVGY